MEKQAETAKPTVEQSLYDEYISNRNKRIIENSKADQLSSKEQDNPGSQGEKATADSSQAEFHDLGDEGDLPELILVGDGDGEPSYSDDSMSLPWETDMLDTPLIGEFAKVHVLVTDPNKYPSIIVTVFFL